MTIVVGLLQPVQDHILQQETSLLQPDDLLGLHESQEHLAMDGTCYYIHN